MKKTIMYITYLLNYQNQKQNRFLQKQESLIRNLEN